MRNFLAVVLIVAIGVGGAWAQTATDLKAQGNVPTTEQRPLETLPGSTGPGPYPPRGATTNPTIQTPSPRLRGGRAAWAFAPLPSRRRRAIGSMTEPQAGALNIACAQLATRPCTTWADSYPAPKNAPTEIVDKLKNGINAGLADSTIKARIADDARRVQRQHLPTGGRR
jgi:hypothetical protein